MAKQQNLPQRHHFIPQMILRNFTANDGLLWYRQRGWEEGKVVRAKPNDVFFKRDLYTRLLADGRKDVSVEHLFSKIESVAANFIDQIRLGAHGGKRITLNDGAWNFWYHFYFHLVKRTPSYMNAITEHSEFDVLIDAAVESYVAGHPDEAGQVDLIRGGLEKNAIVFAQARSPSREIIEAVEQLGLTIFKISDRAKSFIVGDVFGVTARIGGPGLLPSGKEMFVPLAHDIAVGTLAAKKRVEVIDLDRDQVRRMNEATAEACEMVAGRSPELLLSLLKATAYKGVTLSDAQRDRS